MIGKYRVVGSLGRGGFAAVWLCTDPDLERQVAIKVLADIYALDDDIKRRFVQEARILSRLDDERILRVHTIETLPDGRPYFVADFADRGTLRDRMNEAATNGGMQLREALDHSLDIARCLEVAHHHHVIHRDLKPTNVLFKSPPPHRAGTPASDLVLADFGIARAIEDATRADLLTTAAGTVPYMAPEQARGLADRRCDLYAAAVILYELVAGRAPFEAPTDLAVLLRKEKEEYEPLSATRPGVPPEFDAVVARALTADPDLRYQSAAEWTEALLGLPDIELEVSRGAGAAFPEPSQPTLLTPAPVPTSSVVVPPGAPPAEQQPSLGREQSDGEQEPASPPVERPADDMSAAARRPRRLWLVGAAALLVGLVAIVAALRDDPDLQAPAGLTAQAQGEDGARLSWEAASGDVSAYSVIRDGLDLATVDAPDTSYLDSGLEPGNVHRYQIASVHESGERSEPSGLVTFELAADTLTTSAENSTTTVTSGTQPVEVPRIFVHDQMIDAISFADDDRCAPAPVAAGQKAVLECSAEEIGASSVRYAQWDGAELGRWLDGLVAESGRAATSLVQDDGIQIGRQVTYVDGDQGIVAWTYEGPVVPTQSGEARLEGVTQEELDAWWEDARTTLVPRSVPLVFSSGEQYLSVAFDGLFVDGCIARRQGIAAEVRAQFDCRIDDPVGGRYSVIAWNGRTDLAAAFVDEASGGGGSQEEWALGEVVVRVLDDRVVVHWSYGDALVSVRAVVTVGDEDAARAWWAAVR